MTEEPTTAEPQMEAMPTAAGVILTPQEATHYAAIREKEREVAELEEAMQEAAEQHKTARKAFEAADTALRRLIHEGPARADPQKTLPFPNDGEGEYTAPEAWQWASLSSLQGLSEHEQALLVDAGIETLGQLEDLRAGAGLQSIKGIGEATASKIEEAMLQWLTEHRDQAAFCQAAEAATDETAASPVEEHVVNAGLHYRPEPDPADEGVEA